MIKYNYNKDQFHVALRNRVNLYLANSDDHKIRRIASGKWLLFVGIYLASYFSFLFTSSLFLSVLCIVLVAISHVLMAINQGHENLHYSKNKNKILKKRYGFSFVLVGVNPGIWKLLHNQVHHHNTNIDQHDYDIEARGTLLLRFTKSQKKNKVTRFQHLYFPFVYSFLTIWWFFYKDTKYMMHKRIYDHKLNVSTLTILEFLALKFLHLLIYIVIPIIVKQDILLVLSAFLVMHLTQGLLLSLIFQPAHLVSKAKVYYLEKDNKIDHSWAFHQLMTTCNFGNDSRFLNYILGGLNFQIEHHLFPKVSHIHYKSISEIVQTTAQEYNYPYNNYRTYTKALRSHFDYLKMLANQ